ncbi:MAG: hypothetical protein PHS52_08200 [Desulfotomaculaceae bacterium]|nr:hypothetical protein [Desulfotomaculaceae bacterium]
MTLINADFYDLHGAKYHKKSAEISVYNCRDCVTGGDDSIASNESIGTSP